MKVQTNPQKILFILEYYYPHIGGVEHLFYHLTDRLNRKGYQVTVLTNLHDNALKRKETLSGGINVIRLPLRNRYIFSIFSILPAIKYARKNDIIHTTSYNAGLPSMIASIFANKKVIITFHEVWSKLWFKLPEMSRWSQSLHFLFEALLLKLPFDQFVAVSEYTENGLQQVGIPKSKISKVYNGLNYEDYKIENKLIKNSTNKKYQFLYFGRLGISKGVNLIIEAAKLMNKEYKNFNITLLIPNEPLPYLKKIKDDIKHYNLTKCIKIKHSLPFKGLKKKIINCDCVLIPSFSEGFCFSAAESVALRKNIISSGKGALKEVVSGNHITMESLTEHSLKNAMVRAIKNDFDFKVARHFDIQDTVEGYIDLYNQITVR